MKTSSAFRPREDIEELLVDTAVAEVDAYVTDSKHNEQDKADSVEETGIDKVYGNEEDEVYVHIS